jgi:iron complex transport system permease protein
MLLTALATGILAEARVFTQQSLVLLGGSFSNRGWQDVIPALPYMAAGLMLAAPVVGQLNVLSLGDRIAANLGVRPSQTRWLALLAAGVLGGTAVAVAGMVGFVGMLVPHLARLLVGHDFRRIALISIPLGAALVLYADQIARLAFMPSEIPVGLVTALVGAPLMIYIARRVW